MTDQLDNLESRQRPRNGSRVAYWGFRLVALLVTAAAGSFVTAYWKYREAKLETEERFAEAKLRAEASFNSTAPVLDQLQQSESADQKFDHDIERRVAALEAYVRRQQAHGAAAAPAPVQAAPPAFHPVHLPNTLDEAVQQMRSKH